MKKYTIGFIFDATRDLVLLIEKINPAWQRGKLNGVGGKLESYDNTPRAGMRREALEETGLDIPEAHWVEVATLAKEGEFLDYVFYAIHPNIFDAKSMEAEQVKVLSTREVILGRLPTLENIALLVQQCEMVRTMRKDTTKGWVTHPHLFLHYPIDYSDEG